MSPPLSATPFLTAKFGSRPWRYAFTVSAVLHSLVLVGAGLCAIELRPVSRPRDTLEVALSAAEIGDQSTLAPARLVELAPAGSDNKSETLPVGPAEGPGSTAVDQPERTSQVRLAVHGQPLGSHWLSDTRSRAGLADIVGAAIGQRGPATAGDASGGSARGGGGGKASFFGLGAAGRRIVFVVDASNSMNHPYLGEAKTRFGQLKLELAKSILAMTEEQQFYIIFFNEHPIPMPAEGMEHAYPGNQQRFLEWLASVPASGLTDPRPALTMALNLRPDVIYLLTDGTFPRDVQGDLNALRQGVVELNTIAIGDPRAEKSLKPLATRNGGRFTFVP